MGSKPSAPKVQISDHKTGCDSMQLSKITGQTRNSSSELCLCLKKRKPVTIEIWLFFFFFFGRNARHAELPQPGIEPVPTSVETQSLNHCTAMEVLDF